MPSTRDQQLLVATNLPFPLTASLSRLTYCLKKNILCQTASSLTCIVFVFNGFSKSLSSSSSLFFSIVRDLQIFDSGIRMADVEFIAAPLVGLPEEYVLQVIRRDVYTDEFGVGSES